MNVGVFLPFSEAWVTSGSVELDLFLPKVVNSKGSRNPWGPLNVSYSPDEKQLD